MGASFKRGEVLDSQQQNSNDGLHRHRVEHLGMEEEGGQGEKKSRDNDSFEFVLHFTGNDGTF